MWCIGDTCFDSTQLIVLFAGIAFLIMVIVVAISFVQGLSNKEDSGIRQTDMTIQKSAPSSGGYYEDDDQSANTSNHPYPVGWEVILGENKGLGAKVKIDQYDEEEREVYCTLFIEAPIGSKRIRVDYLDDDRYKLGTAVIEYEDPSGKALNVKIGLGDDKLYNCDYAVIIEVTESTFEDIR